LEKMRFASFWMHFHFMNFYNDWCLVFLLKSITYSHNIMAIKTFIRLHEIRNNSTK